MELICENDDGIKHPLKYFCLMGYNFSKIIKTISQSIHSFD